LVGESKGREVKFKIIAVRSNGRTGLIEIQFRPTSRPSARSGRFDFWKVYIPTMRDRPDGTRSALRRLVEAVYTVMPDEQAWEIDLEQMIGHEVDADMVKGRVKPDQEEG
jgi:hypothetical protein